MLDLEDFDTGLDKPPSPVETPIVIRPIRPDDEARLDAFFRSLSPKARHRRFLAVVNELPQALLARLVRPDGRNEAALVATSGTGRAESIVGEARFVADDTGPDCVEFAVAIADRAQGRGLGERMLRGLFRRAVERGITCVFGDVLPDNYAMLSLARKFGFSEGLNPLDPRLVRVRKSLG
jgi:acetyltransferase